MTVTLVLLAAGLSLAQAQSSASREESLKAAFALSADLSQMLNTPIPTDPDVKRPVAVREGERGALAMPECKLTPETLAKVGKDVVPVGQLWLRKVTLQSEGRAIRDTKLQVVEIATGQQTASVSLHALAVQKNADGKLQLLIFGKDKEPILTVPLKEISTKQESPIEMTGTQQGDGAELTLKIVGKYEASFSVGSSE